MRLRISTILILLCIFSAKAEAPKFATVVRSSLIFRDDFDGKRQYPLVLQVFLRLENIHDSDVTWIANARSKSGLEAELLDAAGKPVPSGPQAVSIQSSMGGNSYRLPFGSRLEAQD